MKILKSFLLLAIICAYSIRCTPPTIEFKGIVKDGLNGETLNGLVVSFKGGNEKTVTDDQGHFSISVPYSAMAGFSLIDLNSTRLLKQDSLAADVVLWVTGEGYQKLEYSITSRTEGLVLHIMPDPIDYMESDYTGDYLPFTSQLEADVQWEDIIDGVRLFYENRTQVVKGERELYWNRDLSSPESYEASIKPNRDHFRTILGAVDAREAVSMERLKMVAETDQYSVYEVRWPVQKQIVPRPYLQNWPDLDVPGQIFGEGLFIEPKGDVKGYTIAIPDADQDPEDILGLNSAVDKDSQFARRLAENGFTVVIPVVIDRTNRWSRGTNRPSRSWIYSQGHEMGRTVTGYEVQKMEALIDWFASQKNSTDNIGMAGYGEGGLLAFYTAALDTRVKSTMVSGYFAPREKLSLEPIYRNVWGLLREFGDAEIASLIAPRSLIVEYSEVPEYNGEKNDGTEIEPPGELWTHTFSEVEAEFNRISTLTGSTLGKRDLVQHGSGDPISFGSEEAMNQFMARLDVTKPLPLSTTSPLDLRKEFDNEGRMGRMVEQMVGHTQLLLRDCEYDRVDFVKKYTDQDELRNYFKHELIGWLDDDFLPINAKSKLFDDQPGYTSYDVLMDVLPNVQLWGILTVPKGINAGEKRPVVVLQHGRGGNPTTAMGEGAGYFEVGRKLADLGYVVFTPFGNWTGETRFRWIDRIAKPTKTSLWSSVGRQHQQLIRWFSTLPFVDTSRIALYGKSIGGQTASLVASMLPEYALSINCAYFNEGARKESSIYYSTSFVYHVDSEMPMWNRGHTLEYAEMANYLIYPRPFMVEHGRQDGIALPEWVEYEYSKVSQYYKENGKGELTELDLHKGAHIINFTKSFPFLSKHLNFAH